MKLILPIDLQCIETKYGTILMNPLGKHLFTMNETFSKKLKKSVMDLTLYGGSIIEIER